MPDQVTRLTITRDMAIKALKHVEEGTYPPPDAPREDLMAVQYLLQKEGERLRAEKAELLRRKDEADASSARRAAYSFTASTEVSQGARRHRARVPLMTEVDRASHPQPRVIIHRRRRRDTHPQDTRSHTHGSRNIPAADTAA